VLGTVWQDLRYGVRTLRSNPAFAATAMLSLALGIGANAALFQLVNALLLRSLPVSKPQDLVSIGWKGDANRKGYFWSGPNDFTYPLWEQVRANHAPFTGVLAWANARFNLATAGDARPVAGIYVSGSYFRVLGVPAAIGRVFTEQDDSTACGSTGAVLGEAFWRREYGGDLSAVGRKISLDGHPFDIILRRHIGSGPVGECAGSCRFFASTFFTPDPRRQPRAGRHCRARNTGSGPGRPGNCEGLWCEFERRHPNRDRPRSRPVRSQ
jgi:hypothetical protein